MERATPGALNIETWKIERERDPFGEFDGYRVTFHISTPDGEKIAWPLLVHYAGNSVATAEKEAWRILHGVTDRLAEICEQTAQSLGAPT